MTKTVWILKKNLKRKHIWFLLIGENICSFSSPAGSHNLRYLLVKAAWDEILLLLLWRRVPSAHPVTHSGHTQPGHQRGNSVDWADSKNKVSSFADLEVSDLTWHRRSCCCEWCRPAPSSGLLPLLPAQAGEAGPAEPEHHWTRRRRGGGLQTPPGRANVRHSATTPCGGGGFKNGQAAALHATKSSFN